MILFLDDDLGRTKIFKGYFPNSICVETVQQMIDLLSDSSGAKAVFLDHDLGGETFVDSRRKDCGMEVVRWICKNKPNIENLIVHSMNTIAAEEMHDRLKEANYNVKMMPFKIMNWNELEEIL